MTTKAIKRHGGKDYLATRIIDLMPPRCKNPNAPAADDPGWCHYVEPYFGGGAVLFAQDPEGIGEVVNDLDGQLTNFWRVLAADGDEFDQFVRAVEATPCSQREFQRAKDHKCWTGHSWQDLQQTRPCVDCAVVFFIVNRQSRQALGKDFATLARTRTRRGMNELPSAWLTSVEGLPEVHARMKRVVILNDDALKVIRQQDGPRTLFYLDPPYLHETRTVTDAYQHEMTYEQHEELLHALSQIEGRFLLSGYASQLYNKIAYEESWRRVDFEIDNKAGGGKTKRKMIEAVWMNYPKEPA